MPFSPLEIPLGALDTKTDERMLPNGALLVAENCSAQTVGGYTKRPGYSALATFAGGIRRLASARAALFAATGSITSNLRSYDDVSATWNTLTSYLSGAKTAQEVVGISSKPNIDTVRMTVAVANGYRVDCWADTAPLAIVAITNIATGTRVATQFIDNVGVPVGAIRAVAVGTGVYVVFSVPGPQLIRASYVNCVTGSIGAATTLFSGANVDATLAMFDLSPLNSTDVVLVWKTAGATVRAARITASTHVVNANQQIAAEAPDGPIACYADANTFGSALYHSTAAGGMRACNFAVTTMVTFVPAFTVEAVTVPIAVNCAVTISGNGAMVGAWDRAPSGVTKGYVQWRNWDSAGTLTALFGPIRNVLLASKIAAGSTLMNVYQSSNLQETYFTVRFAVNSVLQFEAMHAYRTAYTSDPPTGAISDFATLSTNVFVWNGALGYKTLAAGTANAACTSFTVDFNAADRTSSEEVRGGLVFAGGTGVRSDGVQVVDQNFLVYPEILSATPGAVGSGGMDPGTYSYVATFEVIDIDGNTDRSTPSLAVSATTTAGAGLGKVDVVLDQLHITRIATAPIIGGGKISLFRTVANAIANDDGSFDYRFVGSAAISQATATVTITDQMNDTVLASSRFLYTNGGVLEREPPPASLQMVQHKNRVWGISTADPKVIFYSGELTPGEGIWYSSLQQVRVEDGGNVTGLASMDDKLVIFKADRVFKLYGGGLNATGTANDLSAPILITGDAGCVDHRSIATANGGLYFRSAKGLYGLSRGEELSYVGEAADKYWSSYASVFAANMMPDRQELRFEVSGGTGVGDALTGAAIAAQKMVLNYVTGQWTTHRNYLDATPIDAVVAGGVYHWATAAGEVYRESASSFLDPASTWVRKLIRLGWIKPAGTQGWVRTQRAMLLAVRKTAHAFTMFCENDYVAGTITATKTWTNAQLVTLPREQVNLHLVRQKGEAYRYTFYDAPDGALGTGEGYSSFSMQLLAQALRGTFEKKLLAAARG